MISKEGTSEADREFKAPEQPKSKNLFKKMAEAAGVGVLLVSSIKSAEASPKRHIDKQHETGKRQESLPIAEQAKHMEGILKKLGYKESKVTPKAENKQDGQFHRFGETYLVVLSKPLEMFVVVDLKNSSQYHEREFLDRIIMSLENSEYANHPAVVKFIEQAKAYGLGGKVEIKKKDTLTVQGANKVLKNMKLDGMFEIISYENELRLVNKGDKKPGNSSPVLTGLEEKNLQNILIELLR